LRPSHLGHHIDLSGDVQKTGSSPPSYRCVPSRQGYSVPPKDPKVVGRNMGTPSRPPATDAGYLRRPVKVSKEDGASVVVRARESRAHGEGRQSVGTLRVPEGRPVDSGHQADRAWLLSVQTKLYQWSRKHPVEQYRELWNWVIDPRNLR